MSGEQSIIRVFSLFGLNDKLLSNYGENFRRGQILECGEDAGEVSLSRNLQQKRAKCGSLPPNAGGLATMR